MAAQSRSPEPVASDRLHFPEMEPVTIGMPQLCRMGLSENWLMKACGHRHWLALAHAFGLDRPAFYDADGDRLYPAFTMVKVEHAKLDTVCEDDRLDFTLDLRRIGVTRFASDIAIRIAGVLIAAVHMESAFVRRAIAGSNRSATRSGVARPCRLLPPGMPAQRLFRAEAWEEQAGFQRSERRVLRRMLIDPSPHEDFNGADFLYFSAFQAMIDRAEWHWLRRSSDPLVTIERSINYLGNIELGERIVATLCGFREEDYATLHWVELLREGDNSAIAVAFSRRRPTIVC